jgi:hypothetical protein
MRSSQSASRNEVGDGHREGGHPAQQFRILGAVNLRWLSPCADWGRARTRAKSHETATRSDRAAHPRALDPAIWDAPVVISGRVFWDGWVRRDLVLPKLGRSA